MGHATVAVASSAVFGSPLPAGSLYTRDAFIETNPHTVQALANAMVRALKWLQTATPEKVAVTVPPEYLVGDRALYLAAFGRNREGYSTDGLFPAAGAEALLRVLRVFEPAVREAAGLKIEDTYTNAFARNVPDKYRN